MQRRTPRARKPAPKPETKPAPQTAPPKEVTIPVRQVHWINKASQLPGRDTNPIARTEKLANGSWWTVEYLPALRHFRITYVNPNRQQDSGVRMVPVERAEHWEPA